LVQRGDEAVEITVVGFLRANLAAHWLDGEQIARFEASRQNDVYRFPTSPALASEVRMDNGWPGEPVVIPEAVAFSIGTNSFDQRLSPGQCASVGTRQPASRTDQ
jgi:hypothetical protein